MAVRLSDSQTSAVYSDGTWIDLIRGADADDFWIWCLIFLGIGIACGYGIFYFIRRARIIEDTPTSKIRSAPQGYVEIIGQISYLANNPIIAPLTGTACAWFSFCIEEERVTHTRDGTTSSWHVVEERTSDDAFQCVDDTGVCMIDPRKAEVHTSTEEIWYGHTRWPSSGPPASKSLFHSGDYRYTERRLHEHEPIYALGQFRTIDPNKAHGSVNEETRAILRVWKQNQAALLQTFDANLDGKIDQDEWEQARVAAEQQAYQQRLGRSDRPAVHILHNTNDYRRPYILSTKPEQSMVSRFKLKAFACTAGFIAAAPIGLWMLIVRLSG